MDHTHGHEHHGGGHSHDHGHGHSHGHGTGEYYLNQLLTVFICGAFGVVAILLYQTLAVGKDGQPTGMITKLLAPQFRFPVLLGGLGLLFVVAFRGVLLWRSAGAAHSHDHHHHHHGHDHKPGEKCDRPDHKHEHCDEPGHVHDASCGHGHDHGDHSAADHEHGAVYWRVILLGFPIFLFLMGVPSRGFSDEWIRARVGESELQATKQEAKVTVEKAQPVDATGRVPQFDLMTLGVYLKNGEEAATSLVGTRIDLKGQFIPVEGGDKEFRLVDLQTTCCATDAKPLTAKCLAGEASKFSVFAKRRDYPVVHVNGIVSEIEKSPSTGEPRAVLYIDTLGSVTSDEASVGETPSKTAQKINDFVIAFVCVLWQAMPFIVLGAVVAGILEEVLPQEAIGKLLPTNPFFAVLIGGALGLIFPMCECGIVVVMRRLLRKGLPLSCCVAYMLAGPIVNLIVLFSTYIAFAGYDVGSGADKTSLGWPMVFLRGGMGFLVACVTGYVVHLLAKGSPTSLLTDSALPTKGSEAAEGTDKPARKSLSERLDNITSTALGDFLDIMAFLIIGSLIAAFIHSKPEWTTEIQSLSLSQPLLAIPAMMLLAVLLCLCSEADAFLAAGFSGAAVSARLGFLVLGPMFDLKLLVMFTRVFRARLILTIVACTVIQVFVYCLILHQFYNPVVGGSAAP